MKIQSFVAVCLCQLFFGKGKAQSSSSSEETNYVGSSVYTPPVVNFNEIFTNSLALLADDSLANIAKDEDFNLSYMPAQFAEFKRPTFSDKLTPKPRYLTSAYRRITTTTTPAPTTTTTTMKKPSTTTESEDSANKVVPIDKPRGVLDLIMPASRVKNFKSLFDGFKRLLSYTFRK